MRYEAEQLPLELKKAMEWVAEVSMMVTFFTALSLFAFVVFFYILAETSVLRNVIRARFLPLQPTPAGDPQFLPLHLGHLEALHQLCTALLVLFAAAIWKDGSVKREGFLWLQDLSAFAAGTGFQIIQD